MTRPVVLLLAALTFVAGVRWDPVAQAQLGRVAWRSAITALRAGDSLAALAQLRAAHEAWPAQPAYSEALVRIGARLGDARSVASTLDLLALQGLGANVVADTAVRLMMARDSDVARAAGSVRSASLGPVRSTVREVYADTNFFAEGLASDDADGTLFITSLKHRNVLIVAANGGTRWLLPEAKAGRAAVFGAKLSANRRTLWLTLAPTAHMGREAGDSLLRAELWEVDRQSGSVRRRIQLGDGKGVPGELALLADGGVLVSDAILGKLYRLRAGASVVETFEHALLRSPQGIAVLRDGRTAIVADWSHGLLRWNLTDNSMSAVEVSSSMALLGIDGLLRSGSELIAVQNGVQPMRVLRIVLSEDASRVVAAETLDRPAESQGEFTVATLRDNTVTYVASSAWPFWSEDGQRLPNTAALPPVLLRSFVLPPRRNGARR